ncbi:unnamed protein product [Amoebophrya sp. A120]|nr:unnamed protein product [Amoebophrya sp. A120]|eukprot:GSA120T00014932001.1
MGIPHGLKRDPPGADIMRLREMVATTFAARAGDVARQHVPGPLRKQCAYAPLLLHFRGSGGNGKSTALAVLTGSALGAVFASGQRAGAACGRRAIVRARGRGSLGGLPASGAAQRLSRSGGATPRQQG